jgi:hypothetical protein
MDQLTIVNSLRQIETLVNRCLEELAGETGITIRTAKALTLPLGASEVNTLPEFILQIRDEGFFREPRTAREVQDELKSRYSCDVDRILMALRRLMERKKLRRTSKLVENKKQVAYVW